MKTIRFISPQPVEDGAGDWSGEYVPAVIAAQLLKALADIAGKGKPGYPALLAYYHDTGNCENPDNCGHCLRIKEARRAIAQAESWGNASRYLTPETSYRKGGTNG